MTLQTFSYWACGHVCTTGTSRLFLIHPANLCAACISYQRGVTHWYLPNTDPVCASAMELGA